MTTYVRNATKVKAELVRNEAGQVICKSACRIHTPVRFVEKDLSRIGVRTYLFGSFPIILETGAYAVTNICGRVEISPSRVSMITIDEVDYYEFIFEAGDVVITTDDILQDDKIIYFVLDELVFQAKVPWYLDYDDMGKLLDSAKHYADSGAASVLETVECLISVIARPKNDNEVYLRSQVDALKDLGPDNIQFIPLTSVHLTVSGTVNRIAGSYFEPALEGALVSPSKKADNVEKILRA